MMAFAADEDEKGCYGRTEYYKRQFFQENEKEDCHRKKGSSIVIVTQIPYITAKCKWVGGPEYRHHHFGKDTIDIYETRYM